MRDAIREFILTNFYVADASSLTDDASLLESGVVDSTGVLEIISFLEERFSIKVADAEMVPDNLDSIRKIVTFLSHKVEPELEPKQAEAS
jgi:acyl carrier protein